MKNILTLCLFTLFIISCSTEKKKTFEYTYGWQKVFQNDAAGETTFGDKTKLIDAVRLGYPIRIGWGGNSVEHVANADFLTIFEGEVFGQIETIIGQAPSMKNDSLKVRFRTQNHWTKIAGTNGYTSGLMIDYFKDTLVGGGNDRYSATTWYVLYPKNPQEIAPTPLWRKSSPNWEKWEKENQ